jgi:hypothetical protein
MNLINRTKFFENYPFRPLKQSQVYKLNFILGKLDVSTSLSTLSEYAYVLATIKHETADKFAPITEMGSQKYLRSKPYYPYIGRGYVQLTWKWNYEKFGKLLDIPLVEDPSLANEPETAWRILELGMTKGLLTGKKLSQYIVDEVYDFYNARRIINGVDCGGLIQSYAEKYYEVLEWEKI